MEMFEEKALKSSALQPKVQVRYVDDTFVIWPHGAEALKRFHAHLNAQQPTIQFTIEEESEKRIPFRIQWLNEKGR